MRNAYQLSADSKRTTTQRCPYAQYVHMSTIHRFRELHVLCASIGSIPQLPSWCKTLMLICLTHNSSQLSHSLGPQVLQVSHRRSRHTPPTRIVLGPVTRTVKRTAHTHTQTHTHTSVACPLLLGCRTQSCMRLSMRTHAGGRRHARLSVRAHTHASPKKCVCVCVCVCHVYSPVQLVPLYTASQVCAQRTLDVYSTVMVLVHSLLTPTVLEHLQVSWQAF